MRINRNARNLSELLNTWLKVYLPQTRRRSENTVNTYESALSLYLDFLESEKQISASTLDEQCFKRTWIEEWITSSENASRSTCDLRLSAIRSLLKYLSSNNALFTPYYLDACQIGKLSHGKGRRVEGISKHAMAVLLSMMNGQDPTSRRDKALFTALYDTGGRISELLNIKVGDLKLNAATPYVIVNGKGDKHRTLLLSSATVSLLRTLIDYEYGSKPCLDGYVFFSRVGGKKTHLSIDAVNQRLKVYSRLAHQICPEVPENMHTHQIRHSACTHWYQDNINLAEISTYLGHESIETTRIYLGISKEELEQALSKREPIEAPKESKYKDIKGGLRSLLKGK